MDMSNYILVEDDGDYYAVPGDFTGSIWTTDDDGDPELRDGVIDLETYDQDEARRKLALMIHDGDSDPPEVSKYNDQILGWGNREYLVVTDEEADELWDQELENYLDECVLGELPESVQCYFDREKWKRDARIDGRAHALSRYDGNEDEVEVDGETFYIYRQG